MKISRIPALAALALTPILFAAPADKAVEFSAAGFYPTKGSGREAANFNVGWRFHRGDAAGAGDRAFDDKPWLAVNLPYGVDGPLTEEASGCANYQGKAWYRKTFTPPEDFKGRRITLRFEGILGKSEIFVNGKSAKKHFCGFLPAIVDITDLLEFGKKNVVAVLADNSDDTSFPPGKDQGNLDYTYFGGVYRNAALVATDFVRVTDPNETDIVAGGGIFAHTDKLSDSEATVGVKTHIANGAKVDGEFTVKTELVGPNGAVSSASTKITIPAGGAQSSEVAVKVADPKPWSPDSPSLYNLTVTVSDKDGRVRDAKKIRIGIRTLEMVPGKGIVLNGKLLDRKLIGANRHQDFAVLGFALPDALHRRDVQKLRDVGMTVMRSAHYPQSPAFMDACDELGMFVIANIPGWQFWNNDPLFARRSYSDVKNLVRRDRNHPCVLMWEPILNETHYPDEYAKNTHTLTHAEYPYPGCYTAADGGARGSQNYDVLFDHPPLTPEGRADAAKKPKVHFTREWGDAPDDWGSHNSENRVTRDWGEHPQLVQAKHYATSPIACTSLDTLFKAPANHVGGTMWHSFDHQRGYHPDPFFGGVMDGFRQPKYSYEMFRSQRRPDLKLDFADSGPAIFVAHEMTPFSPTDITVYSNCEEVRLTYMGKLIGTKKVDHAGPGIPSPITVFPNVFNFDRDCSLWAHPSPNHNLFAEGLIGGKVVATHTVGQSKRPVKIVLKLDTAGVAPVADGSSVVTVVASVTDHNGNVKRLNNGAVSFEVTGEGEIIGDASVGANPRAVRWGDAPALIRAGTKPGKIKVVAKYSPAGVQMPATGTLEFETIASASRFVQDEVPTPGAASPSATAAVKVKESEELATLRLKLEGAQKELLALKNKQVFDDQNEFANKPEKK